MKWILLGLLAWSCFGQRVVSLSSPETETLYAIGARDLLVGVTGTSVFPEQVMGDRASGRVKVLGRFADVDRKLLRELNPTLILTGTSFQRRIADELRREGYVVLHSEPASFADVLAGIRKLGEAVGRGRQARRVAAEMAAGLERLQQRTRGLKPVRVYLEMNHEGPWTSGRRNPVEDLVRAAGGVNIFGDIDESVFRTSHEQVIERAPEVILSPIWVEAKVGGIDGIIPLAEIFRRPGYDATPAWKTSRIHYYDSALLKHTGPRQTLAAWKLAQLLHPEQIEAPQGTLPWEFGRIRQ